MKELFEFSPLVIAIVPIVLGLIEVIKAAGVSSKYAPSISIILSIALLGLTGITWQMMIVQGIIAGLAASGLYSGVKKHTS